MNEEELDVDGLRKALERAQDRLGMARLRAEAPSRAYFYGDAPDPRVREAFEAAMREEADAFLALAALRKSLSCRQASGGDAASA